MPAAPPHRTWVSRPSTVTVPSPHCRREQSLLASNPHCPSALPTASAGMCHHDPRSPWPRAKAVTLLLWKGQHRRAGSSTAVPEQSPEKAAVTEDRVCWVQVTWKRWHMATGPGESPSPPAALTCCGKATPAVPAARTLHISLSTPSEALGATLCSSLPSFFLVLNVCFLNPGSFLEPHSKLRSHSFSTEL